MQMSYSRVSSFDQCPYKWKLHYMDEIKTIDKCDPADALKLGTALHEGIEMGVSTAIHNYFMSYPIITDLHENEAMKLMTLIPKAKELLPKGGEFEVELNSDDFKGFIDYLVPAGGVFDIYDFKYSNNVDRYLQSEQLHVYKYFAEKLLGIKIRNLYFLFVPKTMIRQKKTEDLFQFRRRLGDTLRAMEPHIEQVQYNPNKVIEFLTSTKHVIEAQEFEKRPSRLCDWCDYKDYCKKGSVIDMLPSTNRVDTQTNNYFKFWIYGAPFSGKTTFLDNAPTPLNLNTDGNIKNVTMARLPIKDTKDGRIKKMAWEVFEEAVNDLEKGSDFETIVVDLVEDVYESCRLYMYHELGISHESDDSFRAWDKVRTRFLSTIRRFFNLPYNIAVISHEDRTKDFTSRTGEKYTSIKPNINDKVANKIAGMVDFVGRVVIQSDGSRTLNFKSDDVIFGGGRLDFGVSEILLNWDKLMGLYNDLGIGNGEKNRSEAKTEVPKDDNSAPADVAEPEETVPETAIEETPKRQRRSRKTEPEQVKEPEQGSEADAEKEKPVRKRRRRTESEE